ncbi:hypothetical protein F5Y05DRAFT_80822 [Hypoxylon sp. FL0543]|nr:hypothetical protein F5Y05DRAFT_80822 [Hypoxylon sp. FL0543]
MSLAYSLFDMCPELAPSASTYIQPAPYNFLENTQYLHILTIVCSSYFLVGYNLNSFAKGVSGWQYRHLRSCMWIWTYKREAEFLGAGVGGNIGCPQLHTISADIPLPKPGGQSHEPVVVSIIMCKRKAPKSINISRRCIATSASLYHERTSLKCLAKVPRHRASS